MYRFDKIESLAMMKNVCLYIRIYNEIESTADEILEINVRDYIKEKYNKDIPLFDLAEFRRLAKSFKKEGNIPSLLELDEIIAVYIKNVDKKAKDLNKIIKDKKAEFEAPNNTTVDGFSYSLKELSVLERPVKKQVRYYIWAIILEALFVGVAVTLMSYPILSKVDLDLALSTIGVDFASTPVKSNWVALYVSLFCLSTFIGVIVAWCILRKSLKRALHVQVLIISKVGVIERIQQKINDTQKQLDELISSMKVVEWKDEKLVGIDKINYFLRIDDQFVADDERLEDEKQSVETDENLINSEVKIKETKEIEVEGWENTEFSSVEKKNCNLDLVARIGLITDSIKANNETDSKEFEEVVKLYCGELSSESRENSIVKEKSQLKMYEFYLSMVEKIEPYEKLCKSKFGIDYDGEKYAYRVASEEEKNAVLGYMFSIIEKQFSSAYYSDKFKNKVYNKYNHFKNHEIANATKRSEIYQFYVDFVKDFKKKIANYLR